MDTRYRIVYSGRLSLGHSHHEVVEQLARKFGMSEEEARELVMNGSGRVIKHDLSAAKAERYRNELASVGLEVDIEAQAPSGASGPSLAKPAVSGSGGVSRIDPGIGSGRDGEATVTPIAVDTRRVWVWIQDAWKLFEQSPWTWIGALLLFSLIIIVISLVPGIGWLATNILAPMLTAGLMFGAQAQDRGQGFSVGQLFSGFSARPGPLSLVGVIYSGFMLLIGLIFYLLLTFMVGNPEMISGMTMTAEQFKNLLILLILVPLMLGIPLAMAMFFAPVLVALKAVPVMHAFKLSFMGCLKNILPFLIFGLIALVLFSASVLAFFLGSTVAVFIGILFAIFVLAMVIPVLTISVYTAYRDIFQS